MFVIGHSSSDSSGTAVFKEQAVKAFNKMSIFDYDPESTNMQMQRQLQGAQQNLVDLKKIRQRLSVVPSNLQQFMHKFALDTENMTRGDFSLDLYTRILEEIGFANLPLNIKAAVKEALANDSKFDKEAFLKLLDRNRAIANRTRLLHFMNLLESLQDT